MKNLILIVSAFTLTCLHASKPYFNWGKSIGGNRFDYPQKSILDNENNQIICGIFEDTINLDLEGKKSVLAKSTSKNSSFILKNSFEGYLIWGLSYNNVSTYSVCTDNDNNVYVSGRFFGTVDFDLSSGSQIRVGDSLTNGSGFIMKLDNKGKFIWVQTSLVNETGMVVHLYFKNDRLYANGQFASITFPTDFKGRSKISSLGKNSSKNFLICMDKDANYIWHKTYYSPTNNYLSTIISNSKNEVFIAGLKSDSLVVEDPNLPINLFKYKDVSYNYIIKFDALGNCVWANEFGGNSSSFCDIVLKPNGNVVCFGNFRTQYKYNPIKNNFINCNNYGIVALTLLPNGIPDTAIVIAEGLLTYSNDVVLTCNNEYAITGFYQQEILLKNDPKGVYSHISDKNNKLYIGILDSNFNTLSSTVLGNSLSSISPQNINADCYGNIYINGNFTGSFPSDPDNNSVALTSKGLFDVFFLRFGPYSLSTKKPIKNSIITYPNPCHQELNIQMENAIERSFQIISNEGKWISTQSSNEVALHIDTSALANGLYYINITDKDGMTQVIKFTVLH